MKKLSVFAVAIAAMLFTACGGNKKAQVADEAIQEKSFEQEQVEAKIKVELDSLAAAIGQLKQLPILQNAEGGIELTEQEKQVKPDYLLDAAVAENAATLSEKYRMLSALGVDKKIAQLYDMPVDAYDKAMAKLMADINDPSFKDWDDAGTVYEATQNLYGLMEQNGRINYFWQLGATSLIEQLFIMGQNEEKFIAAFNDESASNVTYRVALLIDAVDRLAAYDPEIEPVAKAIAPLKTLNAINVEQLKEQLAQAKPDIVAAREALLK